MANKAWLNVIGEARDFDECFKWLKRLDEDNDRLREVLKNISEEYINSDADVLRDSISYIKETAKRALKRKN